MLTWNWSDGVLLGTVTGDVPFGTFDVPVHVDGQAHWVEVVDGTGELKLDLENEPAKVDLDPEHRILTVNRVTKRR